MQRRTKENLSILAVMVGVAIIVITLFVGLSPGAGFLPYRFVSEGNTFGFVPREQAEKWVAEMRVEQAQAAANMEYTPIGRAYNEFGCAYDVFNADYSHRYVPVMTPTGPLCDPEKASHK